MMKTTNRGMRWLVAGVLVLLMSGPAMAGMVDINKADAATISKELKGIGPVKAKAIVDYRTKNGSFKSVDELRKVGGIGEHLLAKIRSEVSVGGMDTKKLN